MHATSLSAVRSAEAFNAAGRHLAPRTKTGPSLAAPPNPLDAAGIVRALSSSTIHSKAVCTSHSHHCAMHQHPAVRQQIILLAASASSRPSNIGSTYSGCTCLPPANARSACATSDASNLAAPQHSSQWKDTGARHGRATCVFQSRLDFTKIGPSRLSDSEPTLVKSTRDGKPASRAHVPPYLSIASCDMEDRTTCILPPISNQVCRHGRLHCGEHLHVSVAPFAVGTNAPAQKNDQAMDCVRLRSL